MKKSGIIAAVATFVVAGIITFGATGNTARAAWEVGNTMNREGVVYTITKLPDGDKGGVVVATDWDGEGSTVRIYNKIENEGVFFCNEIGKNAFANEKSIKTVVISAACELKKIPEGAFSGCTNLKEVILNMNTLTSIDKNAFKNCKNLKKLTIKSDKLKKSKIKKNSFVGVGDLTVYVEKMKCEKYADWIEVKGGADSVVVKAAKD